MLFWLIILIIGVVVLSYLFGGGINLEFVKIMLMFVVGILALTAIKRLWDNFKG